MVLAAMELRAEEPSATAGRRPRRLRFAAASTGPALLTPEARSRLDRWGSLPILGRTLSAVATRLLRLVIPLYFPRCEPRHRRGEGEAPSEPALALGSHGDSPSPDVSNPRTYGITRDVHAMPRTNRGVKSLSAIITAHNEGAEVLRTIESIRANTQLNYEIIVVDDGSTDGSCDGLEATGVRVIRHPERIGVAYSRHAGSSAAAGDVFAYLDGHQRVEPGCLDRCAEVAACLGAIACPPCRPLNRRYPVSYGASFGLDAKRGFFSARHRIARPRQEITRISALRSPAYVIPRSAYDRVAWIAGLRGWGATDFSVAVKAFFTDVDILHVSTGATEHLFRKRIPYETSWEGVWRNHALIARVCFDDRTWSRYWLAEVFQKNLSEDVLHELNSPAVLAEHEAFMAVKVRPDREFWRGLLRIPEPKALV